MGHCFEKWLLSAVVLLLALSSTQAGANRIKSAVFLSQKFILGPGSVEDKFYLNMDFPRGHIGLKSFDAEVVDEAGNPVPLHETYLHHWVVEPYYVRKGVESLETDGLKAFNSSDYIWAGNSGICQGNLLRQYYGLGSETRKTSTHVPDPYGIEVGNPEQAPEGYEQRWLLNVHAIDTRGVEDRLGCTECWCDLYNLTTDQHGRPLRKDYKGGLRCCYDQTQCRVRKGFEAAGKRSLYLRYTVKWVEWDSSVLPVKIYIFDVTDTQKKSNGLNGVSLEHSCKIEYDVEPCSSNSAANNECVDVKKTSLVMPFSGYMVYGVAHQHAGGIGSALYREGGEAICSSLPTYGKGSEPGDEEGYIVGMSTCYPEPGSIKITEGETLVHESNYSSTRDHTGVMGLFMIWVADELPKPNPSWHSRVQMPEDVKGSFSFWMPVALLGVVVAAVAGVHYLRRSKEEDGYLPVA